MISILDYFESQNRFWKLLSVICYLKRKKIIFGNCQLSTVTPVTQK